MLETGTPISEYKDSLTLLRSKQQSHYLRGWMKYQSHFLLASVIKENLVDWLFMHFLPSFKKKKKAILMEWKGRRFWRSRLWVNVLLIILFSAFRKENPNQISNAPLHRMINISRTTTKRDVKYLSLCHEWGKLFTIPLSLLQVIVKNILVWIYPLVCQMCCPIATTL